MSLSSRQQKQLLEALIGAFPERASLEQMLYFEFNKNLDAIAGGGSLRQVVFNLIQTAEAEGWVEDLIRGASRSNPGYQQLTTIANEMLGSDSKLQPNISSAKGNSVSINASDTTSTKSQIEPIVFFLRLIPHFFIGFTLTLENLSFFLLIIVVVIFLLYPENFLKLIVWILDNLQEQIHHCSNIFETIKFKNLLITGRYLLALALGGSFFGGLVASSSGSIFGAAGGAIYGLISLNINNPNIWKQGQNVIASALGGAFLGGIIGQIPGSILGAIIGATFKIFTLI
ncbi:hypothetical protein WA1_49485 [Scytonema hofmannii PCC 7110]|uniref:Effector-associated domain-containing protein n=1 Tax=Scytonema hofmannii PCC 7110 TaxID=128403 RepID=A0A139WQS6_9CYAN|nr:effector-associated domain EAD1-containing protein [Scytonema hofmannii]KYC34772.1 hypothetical protein WA1_49485 [Scytonema hofmannii PCC 7110]